jgi:hypothetical protein
MFFICREITIDFHCFFLFCSINCLLCVWLVISIYAYFEQASILIRDVIPFVCLIGHLFFVYFEQTIVSLVMP